MVRIHDRGSKPRRVAVDLQGVPATGVVDSGADITIMGAELFKKVAAVGRLKRSAFKKADKVPYTYDHRPFALDGKMELDITFDNCRMRTPVYVKMDAHDPLLLSEGVYHQLGIISYHPSVDTHDPLPPAPPQAPVLQDVPPEVVVPVMRVKLIQTV